MRVFSLFDVPGITLVIERIPVDALLLAEIEKGENQRSQHRFGMLPTESVERAVCVGDIDRFVPNVAVVARAVAPQHLEDRAGAAIAQERNNRALSALGSQASIAAVNSVLARWDGGRDPAIGRIV